MKLGGDSLLAMQVIARVRDEFDIDVPGGAPRDEVVLWILSAAGRLLSDQQSEIQGDVTRGQSQQP